MSWLQAKAAVNRALQTLCVDEGYGVLRTISVCHTSGACCAGKYGRSATVSTSAWLARRYDRRSRISGKKETKEWFRLDSLCPTHWGKVGHMLKMQKAEWRLKNLKRAGSGRGGLALCGDGRFPFRKWTYIFGVGAVLSPKNEIYPTESDRSFFSNPIQSHEFDVARQKNGRLPGNWKTGF